MKYLALILLLSVGCHRSIGLASQQDPPAEESDAGIDEGSPGYNSPTLPEPISFPTTDAGAPSDDSGSSVAVCPCLPLDSECKAHYKEACK